MCRNLINVGVNINCTNCRNTTPLFAAILKGHVAVAEFLIDEEADVNVKCLKLLTPLMIAVYKKMNTVCFALLEAGADIEAMNDLGMTALDYAIVYDNQHAAKMIRKVIS